MVAEPPTAKRFPPQCGDASCATDIQERPEAFATAVVAAGALLLLVAVNGRKVSGIKVGGAEATLAEQKARDTAAKVLVSADLSAAEASEEHDRDASPEPGAGDARILSIQGRSVVRVDPDQVPVRVLTELASSDAPVRSSADVEWGARQSGQGNHPWFVQLRSGEAYKVSYGGQGKQDPTVTRIGASA